MTTARRTTMVGVLAAAVLLVAYLLLQPRTLRYSSSVISEGDLAPDFTLKTDSGEEIRLADYRGRPVVLNFWATWCPPCRAEMPDLESMYSRGQEQQLMVIGVSLRESAVTVGAFRERHQLTFPLALDEKGTVTELYGVIPLPTTYFIDPEGRVSARVHGQMPPSVLGREIERLSRAR